MATLAEAEQARREHAEKLRRLGAWGVTVDEVKRGATTTFAVVALFETKPQTPVPRALQTSKRGVTTTVPLVVRVQERFRPQ